MQFNANTPDQYLSELEADWRKETLAKVREMIQTHGPALSEGIEYKMLAYQLNGKTVFHLNAQQKYVSLYVGNTQKVENSDTMLKGLDLGKGCIRIKKSINLNETGIEEFIKATIDIHMAGQNTDC
ncbi:iron chaperone [Algoriphagus marincola]|uniref:iron chaperone n=1 Tax=Algoriphagus marincola TaxID=264027 RepID=UPI0004293E26|nr:DUF1801 domain-containing protein [Algoriphagus marincola]